MNKVFVVIEGEKYEGSDVVSLHKSYTSAYQVVLDKIKNDDLAFLGEWEKVTDRLWRRSYSYLMIDKMDLLE